MAPSRLTLLELPCELNLQIFTQLPSREIVRLRTVSRALRDLIDDNAEQMSKEICTRERARLREFISYYVTYEGDVSFLEALSRWGQLRGWAPSKHGLSNVANANSICAFSKHWTPMKRYPDLSEQTQNVISGIARLLREISDDLPGSSTARDRMYRYQYLLRMQQLRQNVPGFTDEECMAMYKELQDSPAGHLPGPPRKIHRIAEGTEGIVFVDPLHAPSLEPSKLWRTAVNPIAYDRLVTPKVANDIFGTPRLPWTNQFTYCIESNSALHTMREIIILHTMNRPIPPLMFAAGMEELQIW